KLNIRPQISEGGTVKLDIYQEVSSIDQASSSATTGIVTNKRAIDTSVLVDDGQIIVPGGLPEDSVTTSANAVPGLSEIPLLVDDGQIIVLGGLLEDSVTTSTNAVPGLSEIPLLGALFRYDSRARTKKNLMVFLRPYVVRDKRDSANVTVNRYDYMRRLQSQAQPGKHWLLPDMQAPLLPPANVPAVGGADYDMRPEALATTMRREPPTTVQTFAVRQFPEPFGGSDPSLPIRASL